jgi:hypothetical protein
MGVENVTGKISLLRVHDRGSAFGPPSDSIDVETIVQFAGRPTEAFGFQLRDDGQGPARQGMLDLLRDGFNNGWIVSIDYERDTAAGKRHGVAFRVALTKPAGLAGGGPGGVLADAMGEASPPETPSKRTKKATVSRSSASRFLPPDS